MGFDNCGVISPIVPCGPGPIVGGVGGVGCVGGIGTTTGVILVLFILLVIILRATRCC